MPNIGKVLQEEIQRLAKRQAKAEVGAIKRDAARLKRRVAELHRR